MGCVSIRLSSSDFLLRRAARPEKFTCARTCKRRAVGGTETELVPAKNRKGNRITFPSSSSLVEKGKPTIRFPDDWWNDTFIGLPLLRKWTHWNKWNAMNHGKLPVKWICNWRATRIEWHGKFKCQRQSGIGVGGTSTEGCTRMTSNNQLIMNNSLRNKWGGRNDFISVILSKSARGKITREVGGVVAGEVALFLHQPFTKGIPQIRAWNCLPLPARQSFTYWKPNYCFSICCYNGIDIPSAEVEVCAPARGISFCLLRSCSADEG